MSEAHNKPVAIETRRDLLFAATKRRSVKSIFVWCVLAFAAGLLASFAIGGVAEIGVDHKAGNQNNSGVIDQISAGDVMV